MIGADAKTINVIIIIIIITITMSLSVISKENAIMYLID